MMHDEKGAAEPFAGIIDLRPSISDRGRLKGYAIAKPVYGPHGGTTWHFHLTEAGTELARRFFRWIGPASLKNFQTFSGLGVRASQAAVEPLRLEPMEDGLCLPEDRAKFEAFKAPKNPQYAVVSVMDAINLLLDNFNQNDLSNLILDRGQIIGAWEYDPETQSIMARLGGGLAETRANPHNEPGIPQFLAHMIRRTGPWSRRP